MAHIARHGVTLDEVEEVYRGEPEARAIYGGRIAVIGPTHSGRMLVVVLEPVGEDEYYPLSARRASRRERRWYERTRGGDE